MTIVVALLAPLSACQSDDSAQGQSLDVSSDRFLNFDQELLAQQQQTPVDQRIDNLTPTLTDPVEVTQEGVYQLQTALFPCSQYNPAALNFTGPRDNQFYWEMTNFQLAPDTNDSAECRLTMTATITEMASPYPGFRVWVS